MSDNLIVSFRNTKGEPIPLDYENIHTVDMRGYPCYSEFKAYGKEEAIPCAPKFSYFPDYIHYKSGGPGEVSVAYPDVQPFGIGMTWEVLGFGKVIVIADNEGKGYMVGQGTEIDFRQEAAKSKVKWVSDRLDKLTEEGYEFSEEIINKVLKAEEMVIKANNSHYEVSADYADEALSNAFWAGEEIELAKADTDIANMDDERRQSLLFGSSYFRPDATTSYHQHFENVCNFATVSIFRSLIEPVEGVNNYQPLDRCLDWLESKNITPKAHPLMFMHSMLPDWVRRLSYESMKEFVYDRVFDTVTAYKDRIKMWEAFNEATTTDVIGFTHEQMIELTSIACKALKDADPDAISLINITAPWCMFVAKDQGDIRRKPWGGNVHSIEYFRELIDNGVDFDVIGIQVYHCGHTHSPARDMAAQSWLMDQYAALGKPLHFTEVQTPSGNNPYPGSWSQVPIGDNGWWHKPWDEDTQADWLEQFYKIMFAKPAVQAITWWDLGEKPSFLLNGGLLNYADQPKKSYKRLESVIKTLKGEE